MIKQINHIITSLFSREQSRKHLTKSRQQATCGGDATEVVLLEGGMHVRSGLSFQAILDTVTQKLLYHS